MSEPPTPDPGAHRGPDPHQPHHPRAGGESGGHTVQDGEQPPPGRRATLSDALEQHPGASAAAHSFDEPIPPTIPLYLRDAATRARDEPSAAAPELESRTRILTAQSAAIVDSLTNSLAEALAISLRPVVASTVVALLPMILSLGSIPEDEWPEAARPASGAASSSKAVPRP